MPLGFGRLIEPVYRAVIARRNAKFDADIGVQKAAIPVICVGNLSVGGTGKTPFVMWLVEHLRAAGCRSGIAMRGYMAQPGAMSDEQAEYSSRLAGVMVAADPERFNAVHALVRHGGCDVAVLDDGFQHRRLARDLDIVLLDATRPVFHDRCLPAGWLREPVRGLSRAGVIVWTHAEAVDAPTIEGLLKSSRRVAPNSVLACARHTWSGLAYEGEDTLRPLEALRGQPVALACGIGNPTALRKALEAQGADVIATLLRPDHHPWGASDLNDLQRLTRGASMLVTTDKDWVKLRGLGVRDYIDTPIVRPRVTMQITQGLEPLLAQVESVIRRRGAASSP